MSIELLLSQLQTDRNTIRAKLVELGMATSTDKLTALAAAISDIINQGSVSAEVKEGETYTIPKGYHNGSGTVSGVSGGGNYKLQSKTVTPTKKQQTVTPDSGNYGLSDVVVEAIPGAYQDVSSVTAGAGDVLTGKIIVLADGTVKSGTMANNGAVSNTLDATTITYTIPKGFHNGSGVVKIVLEEKKVTPTKSAQTITPASGKVLSKVTVDPIPDQYQDVSGVTATADKVLAGSSFVDANGNVVTGSIVDKGNIPGGLIFPANLEEIEDSEIGTYYEAVKLVDGGYYSGGSATLVWAKDVDVTPTKSEQQVDSGHSSMFVRKVNVNPIPDEYITTTDATAEAAEILAGETAYINGVKVTGSMKNNGDTGGEIDGLTKTSVTIPAGYTTGGTVSLTGDIEEALAAI